MSLIKNVLVLTCLFFCGFADSCLAQSTPTEQLGIVPGGSYQSYKVDTVNIANGNAFIHIPLASFPQKGKLDLSYGINLNTTIWQASYECGELYVRCDYFYYTVPSRTNPPLGGGWNQSIGPTLGWDQGYRLIIDDTQSIPNHDPYQGPVIPVYYWAEDNTHARHQLLLDKDDPSKVRSTDGTKLLYSSPGHNLAHYMDDSGPGTLLDSQGVSYDNSQITDSEGNSIALGVKDSAGRTFSSPTQLTSSVVGCPDLSSKANYQPVTGSYQVSLPGANSKNETYLVCVADVAFHTNFWNNNGQTVVTNDQPTLCNDPGRGDCYGYQLYEEESATVSAIQSVVLPDHTFWGFLYDAANPNDTSSLAYGTLSKLLLPTGGSISYQYKMDTVGCDFPLAASPTYNYMRWPSLRLSQRTESDLRGSTSTWAYTGDSLAPNKGVTDPNSNDTVYTFAQDPQGVGGQDLCGSSQETKRQTYQGPSNDGQGKLLETVATTYRYSYVTTGTYVTTPILANALPETVTTTIDGQAVSSTSTYYDSAFVTQFQSGGDAGAVTTVSLGIPKTQIVGVDDRVETDTSYQWESDIRYWNANLLDTPSMVTVQDGNGNQGAQTTTAYDESAYLQASGIFGHPTSSMRWKNSGASITTHTGWTSSGMVDRTVDGTAHTNAQYTYGGQYKGLYPTTVTNALSQPTTYTYDFNTGKTTSVTDPNAATTTYSWYDNGHLKEIVYPDGGDVQYAYSTDQGPPTATSPITVTKTTATGEAAGPIINASVLDGLGRTVQTQLQSDSVQSASPGQTVSSAVTSYVDIAYDGFDRVLRRSNPYRSINDSTYGATSYKYDALGRQLLQCNPDNGNTGACATGSSYLEWQYAGNTTTSYDELRSSWQRTNDSLGRLTNVVEPGGTATSYQYDVLGNLKLVNQTGTSSKTPLLRFFYYDSLSHLITASNPETGTICYGQLSKGNCVNGYDGNGNLLYKTDARGVVTNYSYDALNRLLSKTFTSDASGALASCYQYDTLSSGSGTNLVGRLTAEWTQKLASGASCPSTKPSSAMTSRTLSAYDAMGRITSETQCVGSSCTKDYSSSPTYTYDLAGNITLYGNLIGTAQFTNGYDAASRLSSIADTWTGARQVAPLYPASLFSSPTYTPFGALSTATYGTGLSLSRTYDSRLRVTSEIDTGIAGRGPAMPGRAVISISGGVQAK